MKYVVMPIDAVELRQTMSDGMSALDGEGFKTIAKNLLVVQEVYERVPPDIVAAHENDPQAAAGASFAFGLHTGMELQRRITKFEPERLVAADERAVVERLIARNGSAIVPGSRISIPISVATIVAALDAAPGVRGATPTEVIVDDPMDGFDPLGGPNL